MGTILLPKLRNQDVSLLSLQSLHFAINHLEGDFEMILCLCLQDTCISFQNIRHADSPNDS